MKITRFQIKIFLITTVLLLLIVVSFYTYILSVTRTELKSYTSGNMQKILESNAQNIDSKLSAMDEASIKLQIALAQRNAVISPKPELTNQSLFLAASPPAKVYSSLIEDTYSISGFNKFYLYYPERTALLVSGISIFENVNSNTMDCHRIPDGQWGLALSYEFVLANPTLGKVTKERNFAKNYYMENDQGSKLILTTNVKEEYINSLIYAGLQIKPQYALILDRYGVPLSSRDASDLGVSKEIYRDMIDRILRNDDETFHEIDIQGSNYILNWDYSQKNKWYYVIATSEASVFGSSASYKKTLLLFAAATALLGLLLTAILTRVVERPLEEVGRAADAYKEHQFRYRITKKQPSSEFGQLYDKVNRMADELEEFVRGIEADQTEKINAKIQMLQTEIDPHMLYNSLESLYSIAVINGQEEIATLVMALSRFFRIALSGGRHLVRFEDAFELASQYLTVQNIRSSHQVEFTYSIEEEAKSVYVPKFLLQPVVENSIKHGFRNKRGEWKLEICAAVKDRVLEVTVRDNGIGMSSSEVELLNRKIGSVHFEETSGKGYALRNLNYQIRLKYGESSGIRIESEYGEGVTTRIRICLPEEDREEEETEYV